MPFWASCKAEPWWPHNSNCKRFFKCHGQVWTACPWFVWQTLHRALDEEVWYLCRVWDQPRRGHRRCEGSHCCFEEAAIVALKEQPLLLWGSSHCCFEGAAIVALKEQPLLLWRSSHCCFEGAAIVALKEQPLLLWGSSHCCFEWAAIVALKEQPLLLWYVAWYVPQLDVTTLHTAPKSSSTSARGTSTLTVKLAEETPSSRSQNIDAEEIMGMFSALKMKSPNATICFTSCKIRYIKNSTVYNEETQRQSDRSLWSDLPSNMETANHEATTAIGHQQWASKEYIQQQEGTPWHEDGWKVAENHRSW